MKRFWRNQAGDTIVEVLIAMVLVTAILGGAYVTANRSLENTRDAQEHGEALDIAQGQVESLRGLALSGTTNGAGYTVFSEPDDFCVSGSTFTPAVSLAGSFFGVGTMPSFTQESSGSATYTGPNAPSCQVHPQTNSYVYDVAIDRCDASDYGKPTCGTAQPTNSALFTVHVRWDSVFGTGRDEVTLQYRLYEASS